MSRFRADATALLLITLTALIFFAPVWAGGGWLPYGGGDLVSFLWPAYTFAARMLPAELPLWNPHQYGGSPFWADNQSSVLYPPNLLLSLLTDAPPYWALELLVMLHLWGAGVAMYACLRLARRADRIGPAAAAAGAIAFMFSDVFVTHQGNLNLIAAAAWLPLTFLGVWRGLDPAEGRSRRWILCAGVAAALGLLAGHAQIAYFTALLAGAAGLWRVGGALRHRRYRAAARGAGALLLIGLIAFGLSAATLLPTLEMTGYTPRATLSYEEAARYSLPPQALIGLIAPGVYGRGPAAFHGEWERVEVGAMGAAALLLAIGGAALGVKRRDGLAIFLLLAGAAALLLALGGHFPLHRLAYDLLPGMRSLRVPARFVLLFNFAGATLAALAVHEIGRRTASAPRLLRALPWGVAIVVAAELILIGAGIEVQPADPRAGYAHEDTLAWLSAQPDPPFRIEGATPRWQPDTAALRGGPLFDIYGVSNPLTLAAYDAFYWGVGARGSPAYNFLGAKYIIASDEPPGDSSFVPVYEADSGVTIYLNTGAEPLAHLVYRAVPVATPEEAWGPVHAAGWDPGAVVYVEGGPALDSARPDGASLFFTVYEPNALAVVVNTPAPAYLVLSESAYPGWEAAIDGQPAPLYRANTAFRAIYLPEPGEHTVLLAFRPLSVAAGLAITLLTLVGLAAYLAFCSFSIGGEGGRLKIGG